MTNDQAVGAAGASGGSGGRGSPDITRKIAVINYSYSVETYEGKLLPKNKNF